MIKFNNGDIVICITTGISGIVVDTYIPTASEEQTMIRTNDGRLYHAPTREYRLIHPMTDRYISAIKEHEISRLFPVPWN